MSAFFKRQIENSGDVTLTNEQRVSTALQCRKVNAINNYFIICTYMQIKQEAAQRKALREAKQREKEAQEAVAKGIKTEAQIAEELRIAKEAADAEAAAEAAAREAEERAARAKRKEELNQKWGGGAK